MSDFYLVSDNQGQRNLVENMRSQGANRFAVVDEIDGQLLVQVDGKTATKIAQSNPNFTEYER